MIEPGETGWFPYDIVRSYPEDEVERRRVRYRVDQSVLKEGPPFIEKSSNFALEFNVAGLGWRPLSVRLKGLGLFV